MPRGQGDYAGNSGALHRQKLSAIYVDRRDGGTVSPSSVTHDDAERAIKALDASLSC